MEPKVPDSRGNTSYPVNQLPTYNLLRSYRSPDLGSPTQPIRRLPGSPTRPVKVQQVEPIRPNLQFNSPNSNRRLLFTSSSSPVSPGGQVVRCHSNVSARSQLPVGLPMPTTSSLHSPLDGGPDRFSAEKMKTLEREVMRLTEENRYLSSQLRRFGQTTDASSSSSTCSIHSGECQAVQDKDYKSLVQPHPPFSRVLEVTCCDDTACPQNNYLCYPAAVPPVSCGLNMPLRNSSLSIENLDTKSAFNKPSPASPPSAPTDKEKLLPNHTAPSEMKSSSNSVAGVLMRHERRGSLNTNCPRVGNAVASPGATNQVSHGNGRPVRPATVSYELSDDIKEKEIELTERRYGGRLRSQRAARLIQHGYREYRMRREYNRLKAEKRTSRRIDNIQRSASLLGETPIIKQVPEEPVITRQASVEDLVLERAYWDWQEADRYPDGSSGERTPHRISTSSKIEIQSECTISGSNNVDGHITTSRDSGVDADRQSLTSASGPSTSNSTSSMNSANSDAIVVSNSSHPHSSTNAEPASCGTLTPASVSSTNSAVNSTPTLSPIHIVHTSAASSHPNYNHSSSNIHPALLVKESPIRSSNTLTHYDSPNASISPMCTTQTSSTASSKSSLHSLTEQSVSPSTKSVSRRSHQLGSGHMKAFGAAPSCCHNQEKRRKRMYRIGLNIFNKQPLKGIDMMVKWNFIDNSPVAIARFLITRKGLSRVAIGEFLGNIKNDLAKNVTRQFMREIDLHNKEVDIALRHMMSYFQTPGESQKISHILDEFNFAYVEQNPIRAAAQFRNTDSIMVLCYAIIMLHTDMYNPSIRPHNKMTRDDFVRNLRGTDEGEDMDINLLYSIYDRIRAEEIKALPDHTDQVRKIDEHLTGPLRPTNLVQPHRRLVCYCRLFQVTDIQKKERPTSHQRDVFLFNDIMLVTKTIQKKKKDGTVYQCKNTISLLGVQVFLFETPYYPFGIQIKRIIDGQVLATFNTKSLQDRERFVEDLQECVLEVSEMDRIRIDEELSKQQRSNESNNYTNNTCHSAHYSNSSQAGPACTLYANPCPCQRSRSSSHSSSSSTPMKQQLAVYPSVPSSQNQQSNNPSGRVSVSHCMSHHHHHHHHHHQQHLHQSYPQYTHIQYPQQNFILYHPRIQQNPSTSTNRGSGDSGLVADMDAKLY